MTELSEHQCQLIWAGWALWMIGKDLARQPGARRAASAAWELARGLALCVPLAFALAMPGALPVVDRLLARPRGKGEAR